MRGIRIMMDTRALGTMLLLLTSATPSGGENKLDLYGDPLPPGAVARLGTIRLRHACVDLTFSKDGRHLISCGWDGEVRVWDAATGRLLQRTRLALEPANDKTPLEVVSLSPDGATAALWRQHEKSSQVNGQTVYFFDDTIHLYDTNTGRKSGRFSTNYTADRPDLIFSPNGKLLVAQASNLQQSAVQIWDVATQKKIQTLDIPAERYLYPVAFSPDGKQLAGLTGNHFERDKVPHFDLFLWDGATGQVIRKRANLLDVDARTLIFSPDGKMLAVWGWSTGIHLLETATLKQKTLLKPAKKINATRGNHLAFSPDGRRLAAAYTDPIADPAESRILIWDVANAKESRRLQARERTRLRFAPDSKTLAGQESWGGTEIHLWDVATGRSRQPRPGDSGIRALSASPDGKRIVSVNSDGVPHLWDTVTGQERRAVQVPDLSITACLFTADGKRVISAGQTGPHAEDLAFQVWDVATAKPLRRIEIKEESSYLRSFGISADGSRLTAVVSMVASTSRYALGEQLMIWDLHTGARLHQRPYKPRVRGGVDATGREYHWPNSDHASVAPDGESVIACLGDRLGIEDIATARELVSLPKGLGAPFIFSPDGRLITAAIPNPKQAALDKPETIGWSILETASGEEIVRLQSKGGDKVAFTLDGRCVVMTDKKRLRVIDSATGERLHQMTWPESIRDPRGEVNIGSLAMLADARLATVMVEGDILIWDLAPASWTNPRPLRKLGREALAALWDDLGGNAHAAHHAVATLADAPAQAVPFLNDRLQPMIVVKKRVEQLLADLESEQFETRRAASRKLTELRESIETVLRQKLREKPTLEARRRIQAILDEPRPMTAERLRTRRAIAVLERINTPESRRVLRMLGGNAAAQAALQRLQHR